jgi:hypothetical protein
MTISDSNHPHTRRPVVRVLAALTLFATAGLATAAAPVFRADDFAQFIASTGVTVSNASYRGAASAAAPFANGTAATGIAAGVILSTGIASHALGARGDQPLGSVLGEPGDDALDAYATPALTEDAAFLAFDVTTAGSQIAIRYVFGSDEYAGTLQEDHGDVIAIEVNGVSCANVGGVPVGVSSINASVNASQFVDNEGGARPTPLAGLTVPLECVAQVTPNVPNRVRIAIADAGDGAYDSAVFVAQGSVRAVTGLAPTTSHVVKAVEFRRRDAEQYFVTSDPAEIASLANGALAHEWVRTGEAFNVSVTGTAGAVPVCRFLGTGFAPQGPHFFTSVAEECAARKSDPAWHFEGEAFAWAAPSVDGTCAAGTRPVFRLFNDGAGGAPGHRYTSNAGVAGDMRAKGWIAEGAGAGVIGCAAS